MHRNFLVLSYQQRGSVLLVAIFTMIALGGLGIALLKISSSQQAITTREVLGARAFFAASSGTEWAMTQLFPLATNPLSLPVANCSSKPIEIKFDTQLGETEKGLAGCSALISCFIETSQGSVPMLQYRINSKGVCGAGEFKVTRIQNVWARPIGTQTIHAKKVES